MAARREPPKPGTPEYEWLYGSPGEDPGVDETRVMPVVLPPRSAAPTPPRPTAYQATPATAPARPAPRSAPPRTSGGRGRWILAAVLAWVAFLVITPMLAMQKIEEVDAFPTGERPAEQDGTTYLVLGSDSRADLSPEERARLGTGDDAGQRTDTIMLLHIGAGPDTLVSIPRDSLVPVPGHGTTKINAAYAYGGSPLLVETIEQVTGVRIDHVVQIGFGGFVGVVDAVGGIEICPTQQMDDPLANLHIGAGCQEVDGATALGYARSRHTSGLGDIDRAKHQREVVGAVGKKAASPMSIINPVRYWRVTHAGASTLTVSDGTGAISLGRFALAMSSPDKSCGVPIRDLAVHWDRDRALEFFGLLKADQTEAITGDLCTESGLRG